MRDRHDRITVPDAPRSHEPERGSGRGSTTDAIRPIVSGANRLPIVGAGTDPFAEHVRPATDEALAALRRLLDLNPTVDLRTLDLDRPGIHDTLEWDGLDGVRDDVTALLEPYQRLIRVVPGPDQACSLLESGVYSALQIASMSRSRFVTAHVGSFGGDRVAADAAYDRATVIRGAVMRRQVDIQQRHEPHVVRAKIEPEPKDQR